MENNGKNVQAFLFDQIKKQLPVSVSMVDSIADLLKISNDSAYRRLRGETLINIEELLILCDYFKIPIDTLQESANNYVTFKYLSLSNDNQSLENYLSGILAEMEIVKLATEKHILFTCEDLPIFHYFKYDTLTAFKLYYWNKCILNAPSLEKTKFSKEIFPKNLLDIAYKIYENYTLTPSTEIWTTDTIASVIKQIEFCWESGLIENQEILLEIIFQLEDMMKSIEHNTERGSKSLTDSAPNYTIYCSEVMIGNNCIQVSMNDLQVIYFSFNTFNSMQTHNNSFCKETDTWIKHLQKKSIQISQVSEKQRYQFFNKIKKMISDLKKRLEI